MAAIADAGDAFDYVIVGSGAAGSVLAYRLTEQPGTTVCVLEAGPPDRHPYIHVPGGFIKMLFNPDFTWQFKTEPSEGSGGRSIPATQGRTLGGSSSINGMVYNRGQRADLDTWAQRGNRGWGYVDILPYFKRTERRIGACDERIRGRDGNLPVTDIDWIHPVCEAFIAGAVGLGIPRCADYNSGIGRRVSATSSAPSIAAGGTPPRGCSCIPPKSPAGWRCAPMRAPPRCCSTANAPSACAI
jgi:choline dehydrogenase